MGCHACVDGSPLSNLTCPNVQEGDGVTYIIALQHGSGLQELDLPPVLPPNARFVNHPNHCFDIGTVAWVLDNHVPDPRWGTHDIHRSNMALDRAMPADLPSHVPANLSA
jgi:hypothetical protein